MALIEGVNAVFLGVVRRIGLVDILIDGVKPVLNLELTKPWQHRTDLDQCICLLITSGHGFRSGLRLRLLCERIGNTDGK